MSDPSRDAQRLRVQPMWMGVTIIVDEVTGSGKGEIEVTMPSCWRTSKILRSKVDSTNSRRNTSARRSMMETKYMLGFEKYARMRGNRLA